ncbi:chitobiosyldiphosphodolichol beta-mannosyltransferase-like [Symsagittifera roscoffensis]|uniref:chitobiosyldiphosphodolichol beta-mannosyltransferase-like n=1 Tax=Symsagittifera roscoffensis TaxID=84072 RepID=UPI00307C79D2
MMMVILTTSIFVLVFVVIFVRGLRTPGKRCAVVVVQGDIGRSPRMQYHALSLLNRGYKVTFLGYDESPLIPELLKFKTLKVIGLTVPRCKLSSKLFYLTKAIEQTMYLMVAFCKCDRPSLVLLQNPPCIPTMAVSVLFRFLWGCVLVFDWHNYAHTILALSLKSNSGLLLKLSKIYEMFFSQFSDFNFCVSKAMQKDLNSNWSVHSTVLYDKAPRRFKELNETERGEFLSKTNYFTDMDLRSLLIGNRQDAILLVSSTSWTPDEDFGILLDALVKYNSMCDQQNYKGSVINYPKIVCAITGKGPLKEFYKSTIDNLKLQYVTICTPWLEAEDYPKLIGSADLGICLHTSSSGLDLPMKVVDMFGCNLPVCAVKYHCIGELVEHEVTGLHFEDAKELYDQLERIVSEIGNTNGILERMRGNLRKNNHLRWDEEWDEKAWPILKSAD